MNYMEDKTQEIKNAQNDKEIQDIIIGIYVSTQMDSSIRKELDNWYNESSRG